MLTAKFQPVQALVPFSCQLLTAQTSAIHFPSNCLLINIWEGMSHFHYMVSDINYIKDVDRAKNELIDLKTKILLHWSLTQTSLENSDICWEKPILTLLISTKTFGPSALRNFVNRDFCTWKHQKENNQQWLNTSHDVCVALTMTTL